MGLERADRPTDELSLPVLPSLWPLVPALCKLARRPHGPCFSRRYMKHKRDDEPEKQEDEAVDVTPVMTCVFVVMCCSMLVLLYYFYDHLGGSPRPWLLWRSPVDGRVTGGLPGGFVPSLYWVKVTLPKCKSARGPWGWLGPAARLFPHCALLCSLRDHWDFLPGLLHGPLQLPVAVGPEAAIWQMQVSSFRRPLPSPTQPLAPSFVPEVLHHSLSLAQLLFPFLWPLRLQALLP